jgi:cell division protein FtsB
MVRRARGVTSGDGLEPKLPELTSYKGIAMDYEPALDYAAARSISSDYLKVIEYALENSNHLILIASNIRNITYSWLEFEWRFFLDRQMSYKKNGNLLIFGKFENKESLPTVLRNIELVYYKTENFEKIYNSVKNIEQEKKSKIPNSFFLRIPGQNLSGKIGSNEKEIQQLRKEIEILKQEISKYPNNTENNSIKNNLIFISKASKDYSYSKPLIDYLRKNGFKLFVSEEDLPDLSESDYHLEIDRKLDEAIHLVVIASKGENVKNSNWVMHEWSTFFHEKMDNRKTGNILVVTENIESEKPKLPLSLRKETIIEMKDENFKIIAKYLLKS